MVRPGDTVCCQTVKSTTDWPLACATMPVGLHSERIHARFKHHSRPSIPVGKLSLLTFRASQRSLL
eukprot:5923239-Amphidinium_carterae.1